MYVSMYMHTTKIHMYRLSDNLNSFFGLISMYSLSKRPKFNRNFVLVYQ